MESFSCTLPVVVPRLVCPWPIHRTRFDVLVHALGSPVGSSIQVATRAPVHKLSLQGSSLHPRHLPNLLWFRLGQGLFSAMDQSDRKAHARVHRPRSLHPSVGPLWPWLVSWHVSSSSSSSSTSSRVSRMGHHVANGVFSHVAGSYPLPPKGWQRANLHVVMSAPRHQPYVANACMAYSEHVGT